VRFLVSWASNVLALWIATLIFDGVSYDGRVWVLVVAGLVFGVVNAIIRPVVVLLALPAVVLTLGVALLLVNAFMLWITDKLVPPFEVQGFWTTVGAALVVWAVNMLVHAVVKPDEWRRNRRRSRLLIG
jgi:putative membrane protein